MGGAVQGVSQMTGSALGSLGSLASAPFDIAGSVAGQQQIQGDIGHARDAAEMANSILQQIQAAPDISKPVILEQYRQAGVLTPEMEQYITAQVPSLISTDPALKQAQMQALQQLQERSAQGLTAADRAALNQARLAAQGDVTSRLAAIQQQAAQRGQAGGGAELAAQLMAAQGGANTEAQQADLLAQQSQQAALQAAAQSGGLAGQIQQQQFGQAFQQQQAQNEMNRFNVANQIAQQQRNVGASNQAQAANLANVQNLQNLNTNQANQEAYNQLQRQMQQYNANLQRAALQSGGYQQLGSALSGGYGAHSPLSAQSAAAQQALYGGVGTMAGGALKTFGSMSGGGGGLGSIGSGPGTSSSNPYTSSALSGMTPELGGGQEYASDALAGMFNYNGGKIPDSFTGHNFKQGGQVPGQANVPGDHPANDTVKAFLSPGEIVVPRSLAESKIGKEILKLIHAHNSVKNKMNGSD